MPYTPPLGFHFQVEVLGLTPGDNEVRFTEVSGLSMEMVTEEVPEGGQNRWVQRYPVRAKYPDLVLKRGLLVGSALLTWAREAIEDLNIQPRDVYVKLLNEEHQPLLVWHVYNAFPTKWLVSDLNATNNAVVIETIQLAYQRFTLERG